MDGNYSNYSYISSAARIREILGAPSDQFQEVDSLPDRDRLTYANGFYANCSALFVDIRDSAGLTAHYKRPRLAKLYRAFISEMVAVLNGEFRVREISIVGDCVWAAYNTPYRSDIDNVFNRAFTANTLVKLLNCELKKHDFDRTLQVGIGADYGRALMIKAGYKGSGINDVIYMGDVVNHAAHLASKASRGWAGDPIWTGELFASNLNEHNQGLLTSRYEYGLGSCRTGDVVTTEMNNWIDENY